MITAGLDLGSRRVKAVILHDDRLVSWETSAVNDRLDRLSKKLLSGALRKAGISRFRLPKIGVTGYGRQAIRGIVSFPDVLCVTEAVHHLAPEVVTILEIGGLSTRALAVNPDGSLRDYLENEKCAAGAGRFLEMAAEALEIPLPSLGPLSLASSRPLALTNQCVVFAESELISRLNLGADPTDLVAGLLRNIAERAAGLARKLGFVPPWTVTGGVAKNPGVLYSLQQCLASDSRPLPVDPELVGAFGAALLCRRPTHRPRQKETP